MRDTTEQAKRSGSRKTTRVAQRAFTTVEELLTTAALLGCFVYPMSLAAKTAGQSIAGQMESSHKTLLTQR